MTTDHMTIELATHFGQRFSGLHFVSVQGFGLSVLVIPKAWDSPAAVSLDCTDPESRSAVVVIREGDKASLKVRADVGKALLAWARKSEDVASGHGGSEDDDDMEAVLDRKRDLLVSMKRVSDRNASKSPVQEDSQESLVTNMLALLELSHRLREYVEVDRELDTSEDWGALVDSQGAEFDPALLLLAQKRFVDGMERKLRHIRRGYVPMVEREQLIRGRITQPGLLQIGMGELAIECAFDEFVEATPLYRILVTTLDHIAGGGLQRGLQLEKDVQDSAVGLRRQLAPIPSLPRVVAAQRAGQLRLPAMHRDWQPLLNLARLILRDEVPRGGAPQSTQSAFQWRMNTADIWEAWLRCAAEQGQLATKLSGELKPWKELGGTSRPDLLMKRTGSDAVVVVDAKYKRLKGDPSKADQYQIWFYSLAINNVECAALIYPQIGDSPKDVTNTAGEGWKRNNPELGSKNGIPAVKLHRWVLKFPPQKTDNGEWDKALNSVQKELAKLCDKAVSSDMSAAE